LTQKDNYVIISPGSMVLG